MDLKPFPLQVALGRPRRETRARHVVVPSGDLERLVLPKRGWRPGYSAGASPLEASVDEVGGRAEKVLPGTVARTMDPAGMRQGAVAVACAHVRQAAVVSIAV